MSSSGIEELLSLLGNKVPRLPGYRYLWLAGVIIGIFGTAGLIYTYKEYISDLSKKLKTANVNMRKISFKFISMRIIFLTFLLMVIIPPVPFTIGALVVSSRSQEMPGDAVRALKSIGNLGDEIPYSLWMCYPSKLVRLCERAAVPINRKIISITNNLLSIPLFPESAQYAFSYHQNSKSIKNLILIENSELRKLGELEESYLAYLLKDKKPLTRIGPYLIYELGNYISPENGSDILFLYNSLSQANDLDRLLRGVTLDIISPLDSAIMNKKILIITSLSHKDKRNEDILVNLTELLANYKKTVVIFGKNWSYALVSTISEEKILNILTLLSADNYRIERINPDWMNITTSNITDFIKALYFLVKLSQLWNVNESIEAPHYRKMTVANVLSIIPFKRSAREINIKAESVLIFFKKPSNITMKMREIHRGSNSNKTFFVDRQIKNVLAISLSGESLSLAAPMLDFCPVKSELKIGSYFPLLIDNNGILNVTANTSIGALIRYSNGIHYERINSSYISLKFHNNSYPNIYVRKPAVCVEAFRFQQYMGFIDPILNIMPAETCHSKYMLKMAWWDVSSIHVEIYKKKH